MKIEISLLNFFLTQIYLKIIYFIKKFFVIGPIYLYESAEDSNIGNKTLSSKLLSTIALYHYLLKIFNFNKNV